MRYFLDTEFAERPCSIDLISVAIVADDGREFYAESSDFRDHMANEWVLANVVPQLWSRQPDKFSDWRRNGIEGGWLSRWAIARDVRKFIGTDRPEFWGYYADYDWVVFCWLFGSMIDLPQGWPMYAMDLKQLAMMLGNPELPVQDKDEHHALADARWNKKTWDFLNSLNGKASL